MENELIAFKAMCEILGPLDRDTQTRIVAAVCLLLDIPRVKSTLANE